MLKISRLICLIVLVLCIASIASAEETSIRKYPLPGHGSLELAVPISWKEQVRRPPADLPPTISFSPSAGNEFLISVTAFWHAKGEEGFNSDEKVKQAVDKQWRAIAPSAVEKEMVLQRIKGRDAYGYYFTATDKAPKPGEWEYLTHAEAGTGDLQVFTTILTHRKDSEAINDVVEMIRNMRQVR